MHGRNEQSADQGKDRVQSGMPMPVRHAGWYSLKVVTTDVDSSGGVPVLFMATESMQAHGKNSHGYWLFPCFSVDSAAILSVIEKLKKNTSPDL